MPKRIALEYKGKPYKSISQVASEEGISSTLLYVRLKEGYSIEEAVNLVKNGKREKHLVHGVKYNSLEEIAEAYDMAFSTLKYRVAKSGMSIERAVSKPIVSRTAVPVKFNGRNYESLSDLARAFNLKPNVLRLRLSRKISLEQALSM